jgi:hypothetical protein
LQSQHISGLQPHCQNDCNNLYFQQVATTSSKDQSSRILTVISWSFFLNWFIAIALFLPVFLQSQSHCYKGAITLRQDLQSTTFRFATVFFLQSQHISRSKHTAKDVAITSNLTRLQPHQAKTTLAAILQCHDMELFFYWCFFTRVFCNCFFVQNHCSKVAITLL